ncbi:MAG: hypothetical protein V2A65_01770, partial [Candidatus Omnitrophota bacterium]
MASVSMSKLVNFSAKQQTAFETLKADDCKFLLYGGAAYGGKSYFLRWALILLLGHWYKTLGLKNAQVGLFCEDYPALRDRQLIKMKAEFPSWLCKWKDEDKNWQLCEALGGGILSCRNLDDSSKFASAEFAAIGVDELTKNPKSIFEDLRWRARWKGLPRAKFIGGTNPGGVGHCVPFGEVLTQCGWKEIKDVRVGEMVATLDNEEVLVYLPVEQKIEEFYEGELYEFQSVTAKIVCTPNHKIARRTQTKNKKGRIWHRPSLIEIKKVAEQTNFIRSAKNWLGQDINRFIVPSFACHRRPKLNQPNQINGDDYCELMGWFLSEGFTVDRDKEFGIAQTKEVNRQEIALLLEKTGFDYREHKTGFNVPAPDWWAYLRQFGKCREKFIPNNIKESSIKQLRVFWETAMLGDGCGTHYYTTSQQLANDMQEIGLKLGFSPSISSRQRKNRAGLSYDVNFRKGRDGWMEKSQIKKINYSGKVYCLGIPNVHQFFLRQNGKVWLSGNSWVKSMWIDRQFDANEKEAHLFKYIQAKFDDNPYTTQDYLNTLNSLPEKKRKRFRDGDWSVFEGQFFDEWNEQHQIKPIAISADWERFIALDYGYSGGFSSVGWYAVDFLGKVYRYRELYTQKRTYSELAYDILQANGNDVIDYLVADPAIWGDRPHHDTMIGESGGETMAGILYPSEGDEEIWAKRKDLGIPRTSLITIQKADNSRITGWGRVREYLRVEKDQHGKESPGFYVFDTCRTFIRLFPSAIFSEIHPDDLECEFDHIHDELRYGLMSRPSSPIPLVEEKEAVTSEARAHKQIMDMKKGLQKRAYDNYLGSEM